MKRDRKHPREAREVEIRRQDREVSALGHSTDQEIGIGPPDAARPAALEVVGGPFGIVDRQRFIGKRTQLQPHSLELLRCADAAE